MTVSDFWVRLTTCFTSCCAHHDWLCCDTSEPRGVLIRDGDNLRSLWKLPSHVTVPKPKLKTASTSGNVAYSLWELIGRQESIIEPSSGGRRDESLSVQQSIFHVVKPTWCLLRIRFRSISSQVLWNLYLNNLSAYLSVISKCETTCLTMYPMKRCDEGWSQWRQSSKCWGRPGTQFLKKIKMRYNLNNGDSLRSLRHHLARVSERGNSICNNTGKKR